jgi:GNAT superfamily N-acetyltransferase
VIIVPAELADLPRLLKFRTDAATWLAVLGSDQWSEPFPASHIAASIRRGEVFLIRDHPSADAVATVTLDQEADELLWTEEERSKDALYVHKLAVDRGYGGAGLGVRILDWAGDQAARRGAKWLRLDAWTTNPRLHRYYQELGFEHVRTVHDPEVGGSGWVAQRPAQSNTKHGLVVARNTPGVSPVGATGPERKMRA